MNKLGFAIKLASNGVSMPIVCNKDQWTNKVVDIRDFLKLFTGLAYNEQGHQVSTGNSATFMSFDEEGCFLVLFKAISGRFGDFLSGWIYIPNTIEATGEDIINTYNYVRNILSQSNLSEYRDDIEAFFSKEYPSKEVTATYTPSKGHLFGLRYLGHYSLKEIVGEHRYQPYYGSYNAIFLLEKDGEVEVAKDAANSFRDLTEKDIVKTALLIPPTSASLQQLGRGTKLLTPEGTSFASPTLVNIGETTSLFLTRIGFESIKIDVTATSERQTIDFSKAKIDWKKRIASSMFDITNSNGEKIKNAQIIVNGIDITYQETLFTEEECKQALVKVIAPDYEPYERTHSLLIENNDIVLQRKIKSSQMKIELANGGWADMTLESKDLSDKCNSPLIGYEYDRNYGIGDPKTLRISSRYVWKQRLWGFFASLGTIMLLIALVAFNTWLDTHHFKFGLPPWEKNKVIEKPRPFGPQESEEDSDQIDSTIIDYLNSNTQWSRVQLEKVPLTQGLYDKINEYRFSELVNTNIEGCDNINTIKSLAEEMNEYNIAISGTYSQDGTITVQKWIDKVKSKIDESKVYNGYDVYQEELIKKKAAEDATKKKATEETKRRAAKDATKKKTTEDATKKRAAEDAANNKVKEDASKKKAEDAKKKKKDNPFDL